MDFTEAIQAQALLEVTNGGSEYLLRRIFRWYSTTFHTPLHVTEELPLEYILQHFFEYSIENLDAAGKDRIKKSLLGDDGSDEEFLRRTAEQAKKNAKKNAKKKKAGTKKMERDIEQDFLSAAEVAKVVAQAGAPPNLPDLKIDFSSNLVDDDVLKGS